MGPTITMFLLLIRDLPLTSSRDWLKEKPQKSTITTMKMCMASPAGLPLLQKPTMTTMDPNPTLPMRDWLKKIQKINDYYYEDVYDEAARVVPSIGPLK